MAKKNNFSGIGFLPMNTIVEVVRTSKDGTVVKKKMEYGDWLTFKKQKDFTYTCFQEGFSQFK
jgi:hypothetical protein